MKKLIFISLCVMLFASAASAYNATGTVYNNTGPVLVKVPNPSGTISDGAGATNPITGYADASYSGGWPGSNLVNSTITVSATDPTGAFWGSNSWTALSNNETGKDVYIRASVVINPNLQVVAGPAVFASTGPQEPVSATATMQAGSGAIPVVGFTAEIAYDENAIGFDIPPIPPDSFFDVFYTPTAPGTGTITGTLKAGEPFPPEIIEGTQLELFKIAWDVKEFENPSVTQVVLFDIEFTVDGPDNGLAMQNTSEILLAAPRPISPFVALDSQEDWEEALDANWPNEHIRPLNEAEWHEYMEHWQNIGGDNETDGNDYFEPYPDTNFLPPEPPSGLYVYEGNDANANEPNDAGLVMAWGDATTPDGNYASAWKFDYGKDPDLTNCTIQITVTAPQFSATGQINQVSFSIVDSAGLRMSWWWACGPGNPIPWNTPTTVTINTANLQPGAGTQAATPTASGFASAAAFNLTQAQSFDVDENAQWIFNPVQVPAPGQGPQFVGMWNYWHNLIVTKNSNIDSNKQIYVKWSQPPEELGHGADPTVMDINGWDEWSNYSDFNNMPIMADDWECNDPRPVTDIHWWGSFQNWTLRVPPSVMPQAFHIGIWTDVPAGADPNPAITYSHPGQLIWENICTSYVWNFAGVDIDPQGRADRQDETCFQFTQLLNEDEWFHQEPGPNIYWLSIAPIWTAAQMNNTDFHEWGWKTRPNSQIDDAVRITGATLIPLQVGAQFTAGVPIEFPQSVSWDLAFELTTNEPAYADNPIPGDLTDDSGGPPDGDVDWFDFAVFANNWLTGTTP